MKCPFCNYSESKVIDSRPAEEGATIRRRRECLACQKRFTTYEIVERLPLLVITGHSKPIGVSKNEVLLGGGACSTYLKSKTITGVNYSVFDLTD